MTIIKWDWISKSFSTSKARAESYFNPNPN